MSRTVSITTLPYPAGPAFTRGFRRWLWLCAIGVGLFLVGGCGAGDTRLKLVVPRLPMDQAIAEEVARLFDDAGEIHIDLVVSPDSELPGEEALKSGAADLALVPNSASYDPRLTTVVPLYQTVLHIAYRSDLVTTDIASLIVDRTVFAGPPGSASRQLLETAALREGISSEEINYTAREAPCADIIVVYAAVQSEIQSRIEACGSYRLFSLGSPDRIGSGSAIDSVTLLNPHLKPFVIPEDTYGALTPAPIVTLAVDKLLVARSGLRDTVVYDLLEEILRMKPALSAKNPGLFHGLTDRFDISGSVFVIHPGTQAYLARDEPDLLERYSGVAEVAVTLMIGLISGIYAIFRIYAIRRKNRIDAFCREAIEIRDRAADDSDDASRRQAIREIKALRDSAYGMMIEEKLAADESFNIFVTLTHDIVIELGGMDGGRSD